MPDDLYQILGVSKKATVKTIAKKFRALALKWHPDKNPGDAQAKAKFIQIQQAFDVLSDPDRREHYDATGQMNHRIGESPEESINTLLHGTLYTVIQQKLAAGQNPSHWDIVKAMRESLQTDLKKQQQLYNAAHKTIESLVDVSKRFSSESGTNNILQLMAAAPVQQLEAQAKETNKQIELIEASLKILKKFKFNTLAKPDQFGGMLTQFKGGSSNFGGWTTMGGSSQ